MGFDEITKGKYPCHILGKKRYLKYYGFFVHDYSGYVDIWLVSLSLAQNFIKQHSLSRLVLHNGENHSLMVKTII